MSEFMRFLAGLVAAKLTEAQRDGFACVVCGLNYLATLVAVPHVPVGFVEGCQVFACTSCAEGVRDDEPVVVRPASLGKRYPIPAPPEEAELIRADELAVVEVVRVAGAAPVVRFVSDGETHTWTPKRALAAAGALLGLAEAEEAEGGEDSLWLAGQMAEVVVAIIAAARLVRDEIEAAA